MGLAPEQRKEKVLDMKTEQELQAEVDRDVTLMRPWWAQVATRVHTAVFQPLEDAWDRLTGYLTRVRCGDTSDTDTK